MKIDPLKKYQTRNGRTIEFLHRAPEGWPGGYPWRGLVDKSVMTWDDEGRTCWTNSKSCDLIEVREPIEVEILIDRTGKPFSFAITDTELLDRYAPDRAPHRIATFREVTP